MKRRFNLLALSIILSAGTVFAQGLGVGVAAPAGQLDVLGVAGRPSGIFNDNGVDADFRIESDADANMFFIDAGNNLLGIGTATPGSRFHIVSITNAEEILRLQGTAAQSGNFLEIMNSGGSNLITIASSAGALGVTTFNAQQTAAADFNVKGDVDGSLIYVDASADRVGVGVFVPNAKLDIVNTTNADVVLSVQGTAAQSGDFFEIQNSAGNDLVTISANAGALGGVVFNEQSSDADFRIESDGDANMFFVDAGNNRIGISTNTPEVMLSIDGGNLDIKDLNGAAAITPRAGGAADAGRIYTQYLNTAPALILSDYDEGPQLYFRQAGTGTESAPEFETYFAMLNGSTNLGLGTLSPTAALDLPAATTSAATLRVRTGVVPTVGNAGELYSDGANLWFYDGTGAVWVDLTDNGATANVWSVTGNYAHYNLTSASTYGVGIGDDNADALLEISASAGTVDYFMLSSDDGTDGDRFIVKNTGAATKANFGFGQNTFGTSAENVLAIGNGVAPTTSPADAVQLWTADKNGTAGEASLFLRTEDGTTHVFGDIVGINTSTTVATTGVKLDVRGTISGALPLVAVGCSRYDLDDDDNDQQCLMAAVVPSTNHVWIKGTDGANNRELNEHDIEANWDGWNDFNDPSGGAAGYIMDIDIVVEKGEDKDGNQFVGMIVVRWSDGTIYVLTCDDVNHGITSLDDYAQWNSAGWVSFTSPGM